MTIESDLAACLKTIPALALPGGKFAIYQDVFPQPQAKPTWPALRFTIIGGAIYHDLEGAGDEETDDVRVQIDVVAETTAARREIWNAVRAAMKAYPQPAVLQGSPAFSYDGETKTYRAMGDFIIHGSSD
jgi:hypothetical protein